MNLQFKVGLMVLVGFMILAVMIFMVGDYHFLKSGYHLKIIFNFVEGAGIGSPVMVAGVKVGKVVDISFITKEENQVLLTLWLNAKAKVREDAKVYVSTLGLLGEKYIGITPGSKGSPILKAESTIIGEDPVSIYRLLNSLNEVIGKNKDNIQMTIDNFKETSLLLKEHARGIAANLDALMQSLNEIITPRKEELKITIDNFKKISLDMDEIFNALENVITKVEKGEGILGKLVSDEELAEKLEETIKNLNELTKDLQKHPWKLLRKPRSQRR